MDKKNSVYIATSLDGHIADKKGGIEWLESIPIPENEDMGYVEFINRMDALVMGRNTFETVLGFDLDWPYKVPVFVLSDSLNEIPESHKEKAFLLKGRINDILSKIYNKGYYRLYIDGGKTIQLFLEEDQIDEMIITVFPVLLGGGPRLFSKLSDELEFDLVQSKVYFNQLVQNHYKRKKT